MADMTKGIPSDIICPTFADDHTLATKAPSVTECRKQPAIDSLVKWAHTWKVEMSKPKTTTTVFSRDPKDTNGKANPQLHVDRSSIPVDKELFGVYFDS